MGYKSIFDELTPIRVKEEVKHLPPEVKPQEVVISYNEQQLASVFDQIKLMNDRIDQLQQPEKKRGDVIATIQRDKNGKMQSITIKESI